MQPDGTHQARPATDGAASQIPLGKGAAKGLLLCIVLSGCVWGLHWLITNGHMSITLGLYLTVVLVTVAAVTLGGMWLLVAAKIAQLRGWITLRRCWWVTALLLVLLPAWHVGFRGFIRDYVLAYVAADDSSERLLGWLIGWGGLFVMAWLLISGLLKGGVGRSFMAALVAAAVPAAVGFAATQFVPDSVSREQDRVIRHLRLLNMKDTVDRLRAYSESHQGMPRQLSEVPPFPIRKQASPPTAWGLYPRSVERAGYLYVDQWAGLLPSQFEINNGLVMVYEDPSQTPGKVWVGYANGQVILRSAEEARQAVLRTRQTLSHPMVPATGRNGRGHEPPATTRGA